MNKYLAGGLIFLTGCGVGYGISYVIQKKIFEEKLEEEALKNQQYYIQLAGYEEKVAKTLPKIDDESQKSTEKQPILSEEDDEEPFSEDKKYDFTEQMNRRKEALRSRERVAYDKVPHNYDVVDEENEVDEVEMMINNDDPTGDIKIITGDMFAHDHLGYDDETLLWWENNNLLTTEDYEIIDIPDLIGTAWKDRIGEFEPNVVYVINHTARMKYEIVRQTEDYYDYKD